MATPMPPTHESRHPDQDHIAPVWGSVRAPLSSFIGREEEIDRGRRSARQQDGVRLVTLTGPGGVGKTRLALRVAERLTSHFRDGIVSVSLAPVRDPDLVLSTITQTLGIPDVPNQSATKQLEVALRDQAVLLLLDNFEHVMTPDQKSPNSSPLVLTSRSWSPAGPYSICRANTTLRLRRYRSPSKLPRSRSL